MGFLRKAGENDIRRPLYPGTPEQVATEPRSYTGECLKPLLDRQQAPRRRVPARKTKRPAATARKAG